MNKNEALMKQFASWDIFKLNSETARASRVEARSKCVNNGRRTPTTAIWNNLNTIWGREVIEGPKVSVKPPKSIFERLSIALEGSQMELNEIQIEAA